MLKLMNWSPADYTALSDREERYKQMSERNGLDVEWDGNSVIIECDGLLIVERNGIV